MYMKILEGAFVLFSDAVLYQELVKIEIITSQRLTNKKAFHKIALCLAQRQKVVYNFSSHEPMTSR